MNTYLLTEKQQGEGNGEIETSLFGRHVTEISIPASVTELDYCLSLDDIDGSYEGKRSSLFPFSQSIQEIDVNEENSRYTSVEGVLYNKDMTTMLYFPSGREGEFEIPYGVAQLGGYPYSAFHNSKITSVTMIIGVRFGKQ